MTVQEPGDLSVAITDENIDNFAAIVYEKSQTTPGLKQLGLLSLKEGIGYNQHKTDNLAVLLGFPKDAGSDPNKYDYANGAVTLPEGDNTLLEKVECLKEYTGVPYKATSPAPTSLQDQITATNAIVGDGTGVTGTLTDNISDLWNEVGTGSGGGGNNLSARVNNLENIVGTVPEGTRELADVVGGSDIGSENTITGIIGNTDLGDGNTLTGMASALKATVDDPTSGVAATYSKVGSESITEGGSLSSNVNKINQTLKQMKGSVYVFKGNVNESNIASVIGTPSDWLVWEGGEVWNVDLPSGGTDTLTFNYPKPGSDPGDTMPYSFKQGANFAYVKPEGTNLYGTFDNLGSVADVTNLEGRVGKLESRFDCSTQTVQNWTSAGLNGMLLVTAYSSGMSGNVTYAFIGFFTNGRLMSPQVDLGHFSDGFQIDASGEVSTTHPMDQINVFKLSSVEG